MEIKRVCGVPMGGLPGQTPSLLVGSIFYDRQKLGKDAVKGKFDPVAAKELLDLQLGWSHLTGNPAGLDVIAATPDAMVRYLEFVIEHFKGPIMVDGTDADVKIAGGAGLRFALDPVEKINIRVDFGVSDYGGELYIELMEAF